MKGTNRMTIVAAMGVAIAAMQAQFAQRIGNAVNLATAMGSNTAPGMAIYGNRRTGYTCAQQKRDARKRRNVLREKARR